MILLGALALSTHSCEFSVSYYIVGQTGAQNFWEAPAEYDIRIWRTL
jgi:hypothetical protein